MKIEKINTFDLIEIYEAIKKTGVYCGGYYRCEDGKLYMIKPDGIYRLVELMRFGDVSAVSGSAKKVYPKEESNDKFHKLMKEVAETVRAMNKEEYKKLVDYWISMGY